MRLLVSALGAYANTLGCGGAGVCTWGPTTATLCLSCASLPFASLPAGTRSLTGTPFASLIAIHIIFPPFLAKGPLETGSVYPSATGHGISCRPGQLAAHPGLNDLLQVAGHKRNNLDAVGRNHCLQGPGNSPAHQGADLQFGQTRDLQVRHLTRQARLGLVDDLSGLGFHQLNRPGHIKDRCNTIVPSCKGCFGHFVTNHWVEGGSKAHTFSLRSSAASNYSTSYSTRCAKAEKAGWY